MKNLFSLVVLLLSICALSFAENGIKEQDGISGKEYQKILFSKNDFEKLIDENKIAEARKYLEKSAERGSFIAQRILIECYLSETNISGIDFDYLYEMNFAITGSSKYNEKLRIEKDTEKALKLMASAIENKNPHALLMYALMIKNGVIFDKDESKAKSIITELCKTFDIACFYDWMYYLELKVEELDCNMPLGNIVSPNDADHTFIPENSLDWGCIEIKKDWRGDDVKYLSSKKNDAFKPKGNKKLVPIAAIKTMHGGLADGMAIYAVRPDADDEFYCDRPVMVSENSQYVEELNSSHPGYFGYRYLGSLDNGLQVLSCSYNAGGTLTDRSLFFLAFEKMNIFQFGEVESVNIIKSYGMQDLNIFSEMRDVVYSRIYLKGNVVAYFTLYNSSYYSNLVKNLLIINFESDPQKFEQTKAELLSEICGSGYVKSKNASLDRRPRKKR